MQVTPKEYVDIKESPAPQRVFWGCHDTPLGPVILAMGEEGCIARMDFASGYGLAYDMGEWKKQWPTTEFIPNSARSSHIASQFSQMNVDGLGLASIALYGRAFALRVWRATLEAKLGHITGFAEVSALVQRQRAQAA